MKRWNSNSLLRSHLHLNPCFMRHTALAFNDGLITLQGYINVHLVYGEGMAEGYKF